MRKPRFIQKLFADWFGYFWLPCPVCGQMFGGHEWKDGSIATDTPGLRKGICPDCEKSPAYDPGYTVCGFRVEPARKGKK